MIRLDFAPERMAPGNVADEAAIHVTLLNGLSTLPPAMRAAVVLRYYADLSVDEVAAALGKSPNTIKAQLQTALDRLRVNLAEPAVIPATEARHA
jgi:RNA polymerase sigma factor (sigma-70 family)